MELNIMFRSVEDTIKTEVAQNLNTFSEDSHHESGVNKTSVVAPCSVIVPGEQVGSPSGKPRRIRPTMISAGVSVAMDTTADPKNKSLTTKPECTAIESITISTESGTSATNNKPTPRRVDFITLSSFKKPSACSDDHKQN